MRANKASASTPTKEQAAAKQQKKRNATKRQRRTIEEFAFRQIKPAFLQMVCTVKEKSRNVPVLVLWTMWAHFCSACKELDTEYNPDSGHKIWLDLRKAFIGEYRLIRNRSPAVTEKRTEELQIYVNSVTDEDVTDMPGFKQDAHVVLRDPREWDDRDVPGYGRHLLFKLLFGDNTEVYEKFKASCIDIYDLYVTHGPAHNTRYYREKGVERQAPEEPVSDDASASSPSPVAEPAAAPLSVPLWHDK